MRALLVLLICSFGSSAAAVADSGRVNEPVLLGTRASVWGVLPVYFDPVPVSWLDRAIPGPDEPLNGTATVDVLFDRHGAVVATHIAESTGSERVDRAFQRAFKRSRARDVQVPGRPQSYLVRYTATFWTPDPISRPFSLTPSSLPRLGVFAWSKLDEAPVRITPARDHIVIAPVHRVDGSNTK